MSRILIAEDEENIALGLEDDLSLEGHQILVEADGNGALERACQENFDLIILDVMLPGKDGYEICRRIRQKGDRTPILMLTARSHEAEKVLGFEMGADDYVTKPFSPRELRARVKALLRRGRAGEANEYRFGDYRVDLLRFELSHEDGSVVALTPLEFKLLTAFLRNRGVALSRDQLLDQVWGVGTAITDRVVDTHVNNLRQKIEPDPAQPCYILSVRGMGYRFDG